MDTYENDWTQVLSHAAMALHDGGYLNVPADEAPAILYGALFDALKAYGSGAALIFTKDLRSILEDEYERGRNDR
jgi:hypothetical protein